LLPYAVFGPDRERLYANRILLEYLGLTLEEWRDRFNSSVPTYSSEFLHPDDWERVTEHSHRAFSSGSAFELEMRLRKSDRSYRWFLARYNPEKRRKAHFFVETVTLPFFGSSAVSPSQRLETLWF
jgi:PAS domain-containing protein